jgi:penicillin-binding protein 1A
MYLNKFEFINGAHGIEAASQIYFNKPQSEVSVSEAATLIGMLKNPVLYNPRRFPDKSKERRNSVLYQLKKNKLISSEEYQTWMEEEIDLSDFKRVDQSEGWGPYFRAELTKELRKLLKKEKIKKSDGSEYDLYRDGLKIYTTIDLTYQRYAEQAVWEHLKSLQEKFWRVWKNMDPWTYDANDYQKKLRADILDSQCKSSDRYLKLRDKHLNPIIEDIQETYPELALTDRIIASLDSVSQKKLSFAHLKESGVIHSEKAKSYQTLLEDPVWKDVSRQYHFLQKEFKREFSTPVRMKVFDYSDTGEKEVEMSPLDSVRYHKMHLQSGFLVIEPSTGHVKAWVGGSNHKYFKFDHVTMRRSVGSTMKPFVYTQAMAVANISPCEEFEDIQYTIAPGDAGFSVDKEWSPANADNRFTGNKYNLFHGLLYSKNSITVKILKEMGTVEPIISLMDNLGIDKDLRLANGRPAIPRLPSICLGAVDLTLMEITGAYTAFANNGTYVQPVFISRIEDKNGRVLYQSVPKRKPAINSLYNAVMVSMLKNNVGGKFGMGLKSEIGGKTGTTNDYSDGWFMGVTPNLVLGAWTGGDDKWIRFLNLNDGQGFVTARPIVLKFMQKLEADEKSGYDYLSRFTPPPSDFEDLVNCQKYKSVQPDVEKSLTEKEKLKKDVFDEEF